MKLASLMCVSVIVLAAWGIDRALAAGPDGGGTTDTHNTSTEHKSGPPAGGASRSDGSAPHADPAPAELPSPPESDSHCSAGSTPCPDAPAADTAAPPPPGREPSN
jgi:hypothetical protein